jgi:hypothetical protein
VRTLRSLSLFLGAALLALPALGESHNPADYPLRIHIYRFNQHAHYHNGILDFIEGEGRANLYENGEPKGLDFSFDCGERFMNSSGFETYPAKWKKPGQSLVLLMHKIGSNSASTCEIKVDVKDFAYLMRNGNLTTEPASVFKQWMTQHHYDPEHGLDEPTPSAPAPAGTTAPAAAPPAAPPQ